jgi:DNA-binding LacI/PurR family transcriptional regulator
MSLVQNKDKPVYKQVSEKIYESLLKDQVLPGDRISSVGEFARKYGVSVRTADFAVQDLIKKGVCRRKPKQGTFVARRLHSDPRKRIVLMHSSFSRKDSGMSPMFMAFLDALQKACDKNGATIVYIFGDPAGELEFYQQSRELTIAGVLFTDVCEWEKRQALIEANPDIRFVLVNYHLPEPRTCFPNFFEVLSDEAGSGAWAADYVWERGHRKVCSLKLQLPYEQDYNYRLRMQGFRERFLALGGREKDLSEFRLSDPDICDFSSARRMRAGGPLALRKILEKTSSFTALFCVEGAIAAGIGRAAKDASFEIVGYDVVLPQFPLQAQIHSISIDYFGMAYRAGQLFFAEGVQQCRTVLPVRAELPELSGVNFP